MNNDEFAFFNQQLAAMLRENIPLEGALRQLCANMRGGRLREELHLLEADLVRGTPLQEALAARRLPKFYVQMVQLGVSANDLPGVLVLLADYYQWANLIWSRLKGLLVYPVIVLTAAVVLSFFVTFIGLTVIQGPDYQSIGYVPPAGIVASLWAVPTGTAVLLALAVLALAVPRIRHRLRWRLPAFKEATLSQTAGAIGLMLRSGANLGETLKLAGQLEAGTPAGRELGEWHERLAAGRGRFFELARPSTRFPPLFIWLVANAGEDLAGGFLRAAEIYRARAANRAETLLYAALPCSIVMLGFMILCQILPLVRIITGFMNALDAGSL